MYDEPWVYIWSFNSPTVSRACRQVHILGTNRYYFSVHAKFRFIGVRTEKELFGCSSLLCFLELIPP